MIITINDYTEGASSRRYDTNIYWDEAVNVTSR